MHVRSPSGIAFVEDLRRHGDAIALLHEGEALSYDQLATAVDDAAGALPIGRRLVAVAAANDVQAVISYLAALRAGHPVLLLPSGEPAVAQALIDAWQPAAVLDGACAGRPVERRGAPRHDLHPDLALLLSTSGSTGSPKLVRLSAENLQANASSIAGSLGIVGGDRAVTSLPMHYCYGLSVLHSHLTVGAGLVLSDLSVVDRCFWDLVRSTGVTTIAGVPHTFDLLDRVGFDGVSPTLPNLRLVTQAGGRLPPAHVSRYAEIGKRDGWDLVVMYGQTEATARMAYLPPDLVLSHPETIGVPIPGGSLRIEPIEDVVDEGVGELVYEGPNVMLGYAEVPADLAAGRTTWELRTGDLGRRTASGLYEVVGRRSRFVKLFGLRIDLQRIEELLAGEGVEVRCTGDDQHLVVAVVGGDGRDVGALVRRHVPVPLSAVRVIVVGALPRLVNGKVDDCALVSLAADTLQARPPVAVGAPRTGEGVASLFADVLGLSAVEEDETFVGLGGDSLSYVEASVRLEDLLGTLPAGWQDRTISELEGRRTPPGCLKRLETNVVLRAVAIIMVVGTHAGSFEQRGGAHVLLAIAGYNIARFQLGVAERRDQVRALLTSAGRVAVPAAGWIALLVLFTDGYGIPNIFLVNGHLGAMAFDERWRFWFIEVLVQSVLVLAAAFSIRPVQRLEARRPFAFAIGVVLLALALRHGLVEHLDARHRTVQPQTITWVLALGWAAQRAATVRQRLLVSALVLASVPGFFFGEPVREALIVCGVLLLTWVPRLALPRPLDRVVAPIASASLWIYLTHWHVHDTVTRWTSSPLLGTVASIALGTSIWWVGSRAARRRRHSASRTAERGRPAGQVL